MFIVATQRQDGIPTEVCVPYPLGEGSSHAANIRMAAPANATTDATIRGDTESRGDGTANEVAVSSCIRNPRSYRWFGRRGRRPSSRYVTLTSDKECTRFRGSSAMSGTEQAILPSRPNLAGDEEPRTLHVG